MRDVSYAVVDDRDVLLGVGRHGRSRVAYNVQGLALAEILRNDFEELWRTSEPLEEYIPKVFKVLESKSGERSVLDLVGFPTRDALDLWIRQLPGTGPIDPRREQ